MSFFLSLGNCSYFFPLFFNFPALNEGRIPIKIPEKTKIKEYLLKTNTQTKITK